MPDSEFSWKAWCLEENFHTENLNECFYFTLKPGSKVLSIRKSSDLEPLPKLHESEQFHGTVFLDFEKLAEQYDAIELFVYGDFDLQGLSASEAAANLSLCFDVADIALGLIVVERNTELF